MHLNAVVGKDEHVYLELPHEAQASRTRRGFSTASSGKCCRLRRWLYGMRAAGNAWGKDYAANFVSMGFARGVPPQTVFSNLSRNLRCVVHGGGFIPRLRQRPRLH